MSLPASTHRRLLLQLVLVLLMGAGLLPAPAATAGEVSVGSEGGYPLSREFSYFIDPTEKLTFEDIMEPALQARFKPLPDAGANFGFNRSAIWLRVTLNTAAHTPRDWLLEVAYPPLDHIELFAPGAAGGGRQSAGDHLPFAGRKIPHRNHVLPLALQPGASTTLHLRVQSEGAVTVPATLWQSEALWQHDQATYSALGLYFGLLAGLLLYNLLLFVSVRDPLYLLYVLFAGCMALFQTTLTGMGYQFLWPQATWWNILSPPVGTVMTSILGLLFARKFLSSAARTPRIDKLMLLEAGGLVVALAVALGYSYTLASYMITGLVLVGVTTLIVAGAIGARRGNPGARNFLVSWTVLLLSVVVLAMHNTGLIPSSFVTANAVLFGSAFEMVLLSFALADRINVARRFKQQAQTRIAAEQALVQALSVSQEQLRTSLQEREVILENSIAGIVFLTPEGRLRWANPTLLDIFGAQGRNFDSLERFYLSRDQYLEVGQAVADHLRRGAVYETELQFRRWDGTLIWTSVSGKGVVMDGRVRGSVWVITDISRRKQLEEELRGALAASEDRAVRSAA